MNLVDRLNEDIRKNRKLIVVIGDVILDRWIHGHVAQCQDGCPKFVQHSVVDTPGGAANAGRSLSNWKVDTSIYGYWENDCPIKCRYVEDGEYGEDSEIVFRMDNDGPRERGNKYKWARNEALEMLSHADGVLISDYDKGFMTLELICEVEDRCCRKGIPCVADCKRAPSAYAGCIRKANNEWAAKWGEGAAHVITRGPLPPVDFDISLPPVKCVNHVGAGDCFSAHLTLALAYGFSIREAVVLAHSAGRVYVQHEHNWPPLPSEIAADLDSAIDPIGATVAS